MVDVVVYRIIKRLSALIEMLELRFLTKVVAENAWK